MKTAIILRSALTVFFCLLSLTRAHALTKPRCSPQKNQADWQVYADPHHHFCFLYPKDYVQTQDGKNGVETLHTPDLDILIACCDRQFDLQALVRFAPTGIEFPPGPFVSGANKFYYYGPGGGGVSYADQFFYNLHGKELSIDFDGDYDGKTPSERTKRLERQILATFQTY